jgi:hypothetical protein
MLVVFDCAQLAQEYFTSGRQALVGMNEPPGCLKAWEFELLSEY